MPYDKNGQELKVGDTVTIEATVTDISSTPDYCNLTVETCECRKPDNTKETICLNSSVVTKATGIVLAIALFLASAPVRADEIAGDADLIILKRKVAALEKDVTELKGDVFIIKDKLASVDSKLDAILAAVGNKSAPKTATAVAPAPATPQLVFDNPWSPGRLVFPQPLASGGAFNDVSMMTQPRAPSFMSSSYSASAMASSCASGSCGTMSRSRGLFGRMLRR